MSKPQFSFMKSLFKGHIEPQYLKSYPFYTTEREEEFSSMLQTIDEWMQENCKSQEFDENQKLPEEFLQGCRDMGLFGLIIPEAFGGLALSQTMYARLLELLARYDTSVTTTIGAHQSIGLKALYLFGTEAQKEQYMPRLATGELIAAFALTEPGAGSDVASMKSYCVRKDDCYILNGSKLWITNGAFADFFTVFAKETIEGKEKVTALIVTRDMGGVSHGPEEHKLGLKASSTVEIFFKDVKVPLENVIGQPGDGFKIAMGVLNQGRTGLATGALGNIKAVINQCATYAKERKTFGKPIAEYGLIQHMVSKMAQQAYTLESMAYLTTSLIDKGEIDYSVEAALCKVYASEASFECTNTAVQLHGGNGYMKDYGLERRLRDTRITTIYEGTNEILRIFIALTGIKEPANDLKNALSGIRNLAKFDLAKSSPVLGFLVEEIKRKTGPQELDGFLPELSFEIKTLSKVVHTLAAYTQKLIRKYGKKIMDEQMQLARLSDMAMQVFIITSVFTRIHTVLEKHGGAQKNAAELELARLIIANAADQVRYIGHDIRMCRDSEIEKVARHVFECEKYPFEMINTK